MPGDTLYAILRVDERASASQIRSAYLVLARERHPDRGAETASFQDLVNAYEVLSDPGRRAAYDAELSGLRHRHRPQRRADDDFAPMPSFPGYDGRGFPPFPSFPSFPSFPTFPSFGGDPVAGMDPFAGMGPFARNSGSHFANDRSPFGAGFPFGPNMPSNSPFGGNFPFGWESMSNDPFFSGGRGRRQDPFAAFFDAEPEARDACAESDIVPASGGQTVPAQREAGDSRMRQNYEQLLAQNPSTSNEYVIKDANGNPCGWGYSATWSSSSQSNSNGNNRRG